MTAEAQVGSARRVEREEPVAPGCPVHVDADGVWHVQSFAAARALLRSTETRQGGFGVDEARRLVAKIRPPVLWRDGPEHREHRRQTARFFTPRRVDEGCRNVEVLGECMTFAAAGMITTREFITVAAWHLFTDEALRTAYVTGDEEARFGVLHEILRLEPVVANLARWTTGEVAVPGGDG